MIIIITIFYFVKGAKSKFQKLYWNKSQSKEWEFHAHPCGNEISIPHHKNSYKLECGPTSSMVQLKVRIKLPNHPILRRKI